MVVLTSGSAICHHVRILRNTAVRQSVCAEDTRFEDVRISVFIQFYVCAQLLGLLIPHIAIISIRSFECIIKAASSQ